MASKRVLTVNWMFTSKVLADGVAHMMHRVTGDPTRMAHYGRGQYRVERFTGTRWVNA